MTQLPGIMAKDKVTIVVTPLLALMLEQVQSCTQILVNCVMECLCAMRMLRMTQLMCSICRIDHVVNSFLSQA